MVSDWKIPLLYTIVAYRGNQSRKRYIRFMGNLISLNAYDVASLMNMYLKKHINGKNGDISTGPGLEPAFRPGDRSTI